MDQKNMLLTANISDKLKFINFLQILSFLLDTFIKSLGKDDFKYSSKQFDSEILDLVKQKEFYFFEYLSGFKTFSRKTA